MYGRTGESEKVFIWRSEGAGNAITATKISVVFNRSREEGRILTKLT